MKVHGITSSAKKHFTQPDVVDFFTRHAATGAQIPIGHKVALNRFVEYMVSIGEWANVKDMCVPMGNILAGALVKQKYPATKPSSLTNNGFVGSDWVPGTGLVPNGNPTSAKYLSLGINCNDHFTFDNFSIICAFGSNMLAPQGNFSALIGPDTQYFSLYSANSSIGVRFNGGGTGPALFHNPSGGPILINGVSASDLRYYNRGREESGTTYTTTRTAPATDFGITLFKANTYLGAVNFWGYCLGTQFSVSNVPLIDKAFRKLLRGLGYKFYEVVYEGDSISYGNIYQPDGLAVAGNNYMYANIAVSGTTTSQMITNTSSLLPGLVDFPSWMIYHIFGGINDVKNATPGSNIAPGAYANILTCVAKAKSLGIVKIVVGTLMAYSGTNQTDVQRELDAMNTLIYNGASAHGYVVADYHSDPNLQTISGTYFQDGIHPNTAGYTLMGAKEAVALDAAVSTLW